MTAADLRALVNRSGSHFFDRKTMKFFQSKLHGVYEGPNGIYFVTSEKPPHSGRRYTVRHWNPERGDSGGVEHVGELAAYVFKDDAAGVARKLAGRYPRVRR